MAIVNGLKTQRYYTGNGVQTVFNFAMDYLRPNFMYLRVDGVQKTYGVDYLVTGQEMQIFVPPPHLATVFIYRSTSTDPLVSWADASVLRASDMTLQEMQLLQGQEEISDIVSNDIADLTLRAESARDRAVIAETNSELSADTAKVSEDNAKASELSATASAGSALVSKDASKVSEDNAKISELNAKVSETNSKTSEDNALASANNALSSKDASKISEDNAKVSELACADYKTQMVDLGAYTKAESESRYAPVGTPDNIVNGLKINPLSGLQVSIDQGRAIISEQVVRYDVFTDTIVLSPRMASLIYAKVDKTIGKVDAKLPEADANTIVRYDFTKWDGTSAIPNSAVGVNGNTIAVANALTKSGIVNRVDGHCGYAMQGDGVTGYGTSANSTGFPIGANERHLTSFLITGAIVANTPLAGYGAEYSSIAEFEFIIIGSNLGMWFSGSSPNFDTGFTLEPYKTYIFDATYDGTTVKVYVNGVYIISFTVTLATAAGVLRINKDSGASGGNLKGTHLYHYIELRNKMRTPAQIAQIANDLLLPCTYDGVDIRSILPANSISLGYAKTSSTAVIAIDSNSYKYGIRQGAVGGNRRVALGWKYFSGVTTLKWDNPFGTRKVRSYCTWSQDTNGTNETPAQPQLYGGPAGSYGIQYKSTTAIPIQIDTLNLGVANFNNAWQTTGYIQCYAEVIE